MLKITVIKDNSIKRIGSNTDAIGKNILSTVLLLLSGLLFSQQFQITGKIINEKNDPVEFTEVILLTQDSVAITSELSDAQGFFTIKRAHGKYILQVKYLKDIVFYKDIDLQANMDLGNIKTDKIQEIKEVVLERKKKFIERKVDRLVFNVENSISSLGGDALDALKVTPNINIQNDQIYMIGKSGMSVMIDDRLIQLSGDDLISFLKNIKSDDIKSIEVITNPPAKYDAAGNSGIINIKMKKAKKNSISGNLKTSYTQATYPLGSLGGGLNYQKNKLTINSNINYSNGSIAPYQEYTISYPNYTWFETNTARSLQNNWSGNISLDYQISPKTTIGIQYSGASGQSIRKGINTSSIMNNNLITDSLVITPSRLEMNRKTHSLNIHSVTKMNNEGALFSMDIDYFKYTLHMNNNFNTNTFLPDRTEVPDRYSAANNLNNQDIDIYSAKADFETPLKWMKFSFGGKVSFINNDSNVSYFNTTSASPDFDPSRSNVFNYKENIQAVYISGNKELSQKWILQLGLRLENTQTKGYSETLSQTTKNNYLKLFPTFYLTYKLSEESTLGLNYNRRIDRPSFSKLNPFRFYTSSFNYSEGNPFLQPYFTDNIELSHTYKNLYSSVYAYNLTNGFDEVMNVSAGSAIQIVKPINFYTEKSIGWVESYTFNQWKWWESNNQFNLYYSQTTSKTPNVVSNIDGWTFSLKSNNVFNLNKAKTIRSELNFFYKSSSVAGSFKVSDFYYFDAGFNFLFLKNKLQTAVNFMDVFRTQKRTFIQYVNGIKQENFDYRDTQKIRLSLTWNFGKSIKGQNKKFSNDEEKKRVN
ncbi:TonB-dependent receptor domain-containing protein [Chryseobacterium indologenes]|nr:TonB-dependent receptor [Chryseobacterium indologenes]